MWVFKNSGIFNPYPDLDGFWMFGHVDINDVSYDPSYLSAI